ncbi:MAG TPA: ring-cleaving dioxygenase [Fimbriimonas sp.]|nr:ring-cleaving dioxygenase [Fimbriimonas sp.]
MAAILGIHHMTAICGPGQENLDFYSGVLGLRLVKLTVNFDDPAAHHLYYGDSTGAPGTILTFFPYPNGYPGRPGRGQVTVTSLSIPRDAVQYWVDRFKNHEIEFDKPQSREGGQTIGFRAPDGLPLELVATNEHEPCARWEDSPVPFAKAVGAIRSVTLVVGALEPTERVLIELLGMQKVAEKDYRHRYGLGDDGPYRVLDVVVDPTGPTGRSGHGSVHHVAFRTPNEETQENLRQRLIEGGLHVSDVRDRTYFKSVYFREPGGVLFEIATDTPGFVIDEKEETLGTELKLPAQFESHRRQIEKALPPLKRK